MPAWEQDVRVLQKIPDIAVEVGLTPDQVISSVRALEADGLLEVTWHMGGNYGRISNASGEARRRIGQWPSAENFVDRLVTTLDERIEQAPEGDERSRLQKMRAGFAGASRDLAVDITGTAISRWLGG